MIVSAVLFTFLICAGTGDQWAKQSASPFNRISQQEPDLVVERLPSDKPERLRFRVELRNKDFRPLIVPAWALSSEHLRISLEDKDHKRIPLRESFVIVDGPEEFGLPKPKPPPDTRIGAGDFYGMEITRTPLPNYEVAFVRVEFVMLKEDAQEGGWSGRLTRTFALTTPFLGVALKRVPSPPSQRGSANPSRGWVRQRHNDYPLKASIELLTPRPRVKQPVRFRVTMTNKSPGELRLLTWNYATLNVKNSRGKLADGREVGPLLIGHFPVPSPTDFIPLQEFETFSRIQTVAFLKPGRYTVQAGYEGQDWRSMGGPTLWLGEARSNTVHIRVAR